jgi:hypothetical protein
LKLIAHSRRKLTGSLYDKHKPYFKVTSWMQIRSKNLDSHGGKEACVYTEHNKVSLIQGGTNKQNDACSSEHIVLWCAQGAFFPYLWGPGPPVLASIAAEANSPAE